MTKERRIVIADDSRAELSLFKAYLESVPGLEIFGSLDEDDLVAKVQELGFDNVPLVLSDIRMKSGDSGFTATSRLRQFGFNGQIWLMSGASENYTGEFRERTRKAGADRYYRKQNGALVPDIENFYAS